MTAKVHEFTAGFLFAGLGAGALGFIEALGQLGEDRARFRNLGGVDFDPDACKDFEALTGGPSLCADIAKLQPAELLTFMGARRPDAIFASPPCKGMSRLLGKAAAEKEKYQELNSLVFKGLFIVLEAWPKDPPPLIVLENVPGITSRGASFLHQVRTMLLGAGYRLHEATHDCGEVGGLAQHRRRFLLVARRQRALKAYVYQPPKQRVRGCGEVLGELPLPEAPEAGPLHRMPRISALNWLRLALIPPGGDWRDLPKAVEPAPGNPDKHRNKYAVTPFDEPAPTVTGAGRPGSGGPSVADPRVAIVDSTARHTNKFAVQRFDEPARTVIGVAGASTGAPNVADPRIPLAQSGAAADTFKGRPGLFGVLGWDAPGQAVTGNASISGSNTPSAVADPRLPRAASRDERHGGTLGVVPWTDPAHAVTGSMQPGSSNTPAAVADPRVPLGHEPRKGSFGVLGFGEPAGAVTGAMHPARSNTPAAIADPRLVVPSRERNQGQLGVLGWAEPAHVIRAAHDVRRATAAVADPRLASPLAPGQPRREVFRREPVTAWDQPAAAVTGPGGSQGAQNVADPRVGLTCLARAGAYGVLGWEQPSNTITGIARIDNGSVAVADPRLGEPIPLAQALEDFALLENTRKAPPSPPVIVAADGTWHRPLTDLELAALQGIPSKVNGQPLQLSRGGRISTIRERIGNAVPVGAANAIATSLLKALLASALGTWFLSSDEVWVRKDGRREDSFDVHPQAEVMAHG